MRAVEGAAGGGVARAVVLQQRAVAVLDLDRAVVRAAASPSSRRARSRRREIPALLARGGERAGKPGHRFRARGRHRHRDLGGLVLDRVEPMRIAVRVLQQPVARAQRALERGDAAGMLRVDRQHQAVEEAAALRGRAVEQRVHGRRQPHHAQVIGKGRRRGDRSRGRCGICARARNPRPPADRCRCRAWRAPACPRSPPTPPRRRRLRKRPIPPWWRGASPRPGASSEIASIRLVLPAPLAPVSTTGPASPSVDLRGVIAAEIASASGGG